MVVAVVVAVVAAVVVAVAVAVVAIVVLLRVVFCSSFDQLGSSGWLSLSNCLVGSAGFLLIWVGFFRLFCFSLFQFCG